MPVVRKGPSAIGQGTEPPYVANPDPPIEPGRSTDVDPSTRIEQVGEQVPAIPLEPEQGPAGLAAFASNPAPLLTSITSSGPVGWTPPEEVPNGVVLTYDEGGEQYLVVSRPWARIAREDGQVVTGMFGDTVILTPESAARGVETGALKLLA